jgi:hypothetical protein
MYHQCGYNIKEGGSSGKLPSYIVKRTGNKIKEKWKNPNYREKNTRHLKNMSEETKIKISESKKGIKLPESHRKNISRSLKGKSKPEGVGKKISAAKTGMKYNWKNKKTWYDFPEEVRKSIIEKKTKWKCKEERTKYHVEKRKQKRRHLVKCFNDKGPIDYIICKNTGEVYSSIKDISEKLGLTPCSIKDQLIGLYSHNKGHSFITIHKNPESEGDNL